MEKPKDFEEPNHYDDHDHNIQDGFNFTIHRNVGVYKPQKNTCGNENK
jgi:hypothetical protein